MQNLMRMFSMCCALTLGLAAQSSGTWSLDGLEVDPVVVQPHTAVNVTIANDDTSSNGVHVVVWVLIVPDGEDPPYWVIKSGYGEGGVEVDPGDSTGFGCGTNEKVVVYNLSGNPSTCTGTWSHP